VGRLGAGAVTAPRTFRLTVAYDGSDFHGWQRQPGVRTVQGQLESALAQVLDETVTTVGAGRTDAGVHARGQVASFTSRAALPARALPPLLHRVLPDDLRVVDAAEAPEGFHARHSARARRYEYRLLPAPDVLRQRYAWSPPGRLPALATLGAASAPLVGEHDCTAFQAASEQPGRPVCRVTRGEWRVWEDGLAFTIVADHFLYRMVRNLVGTLLAAARTADPAAHIARVLASRDRGVAGRTAPPAGLSLEQVYFEGDACS